MRYRMLAVACIGAARATRGTLMLVQRSAFAACGQAVRFDPYGSYTHSTIYLGDEVSIGPGATLWAVRPAFIEIRDKVMLGPNVTIMAGNHVTDIAGRYMADIRLKKPGSDQPVVIERDVWVGANATVLKGVTIGRGSIVAAGAVVTHSVDPYSVMAGVPAVKLRSRFGPDDVALHERFLGAEVPLPGVPWREHG